MAPATSPAIPSSRSANASDDGGAVLAQGPVWIGKDFWLDHSPIGTNTSATLQVAAAPAAGPTGAGVTDTPCCIAKGASCGGSCHIEDGTPGEGLRTLDFQCSAFFSGVENGESARVPACMGSFNDL